MGIIFLFAISLVPAPGAAAKPTITTITINSTFGKNYTSENLSITTDQDDNASVKIIYNWFKNSVSLTTLNLPFEGGSGSLTEDFSGRGIIANATNATFNSTGGYDGFGAYEFDGDLDFINVSPVTHMDNNEVYSISIWIKTLDNSTTQTLFEKGSVNVKLDGNKLSVSSFDLTSAGFLNNSEWTQLFLTYNYTVLNIYRNAVLNYTWGAAPPGALKLPVGNLIIGEDVSNPSSWNGTIDEVVFYNTALSEEQIKAIYENKTDLIVSQETSLGEIWKCNITPNDGIPGDSTFSENLTIRQKLNITLNQPANNSAKSSETSTVFNFSLIFNDLSSILNCSLWGNWNSVWENKQTINQIPNNITQESNFTNVTSLNSANSVFVKDYVAYVASTTGDSLTIINVSNNSAPTQISWIQNTSSLNGASAVNVVNDIAYVVTSVNHSLTLINVSNNSNPTQISSFCNVSSLNSATGLNVSADGNYVYVSAFSSNALTILNTTNKTNITQISSFQNATSISGATSVAIQDNFSYVTSLSKDSLTIINVSNKSNPVQLSSIANATSIDNAYSVAIKDDYAYVTPNSNSKSILTIINISNKSNPVQISSINNTFSFYTRFVKTSGDYAYVTSDANLTIINISNKFNPEIVSNFTNATTMNTANNLDIFNGYVYVVAGEGKALTILNPWSIKNNTLNSFSSTSVYAGDYLWNVKCYENSLSEFADNNFTLTINKYCGNNVCETGENYLTCSDCADPSSSLSSSGGFVSQGTPKTQKINFNDFLMPQKIVLSKNQKAEFTLKQKHSLTLNSVFDTKVILTLASNPTVFNLSINETKEFELDDLILEITLNSIKNSKAEFILQTKELEESQLTSADKLIQKTKNYYVGIIVLIVIASLVLVSLNKDLRKSLSKLYK